MNDPISKNTTVVAVKDQVWYELSGEALILHLKSSVSYGLNLYRLISSRLLRGVYFSCVSNPLVDHWERGSSLCIN